MTASLLETVEVQTDPRPTATILWMHGLGADGHDFEPLVPHLDAAIQLPLRFVFPHAPVRPITINAGMRMRAWYDIPDLALKNREDEVGIRTSAAAIEDLIRRENERGIASSRIVLAGFSQGGAMALYLAARYPQKLAGVVALSCYLALAGKLTSESLAVNRSTPIFLAHGSADPMISQERGQESRAALEAAGYEVQWRSYRMGHEVCGQEIADIALFLRRILSG